MSQSPSKHEGHQSEASKAAMHEQDQITIEKQHGAGTEAVPPADGGSHAHSAAAHLHVNEHAKTGGSPSHGSNPEDLRELPMVTQRYEKELKR